MELDLQRFVETLKNEEVRRSIDVPVVSEYVMQHIYEPLRHDEQVFFTDLDFNAFDESDLQALAELMDVFSHTEQQLLILSKKFCETSPCSVTHRAFC